MLVLRYAEDTYIESYISTIGVDFKIRTIEQDGKVVKMQIWDTAGQERFNSITQSYYRGAHGIFVVYDITNKESFDNVGKWVNTVLACCTSNRIPRLVLVGAKSDLAEKRAVPTDVAQEFATSMDMDFIEVSAKTNNNVDYMFNSMCNQLRSRTTNIPTDTTKPAANVDSAVVLKLTSKSGGCC